MSTALLGLALALCLAACRTGDAAPGPRAETETRETALARAAARGDLANARLLLSAGTPADTPDPTGHTPLTRACMAGQLAIAELLLRAGAPPDQERDPGVTPLLIAAVNGHADIVGLLLERGADIRRLDINYLARWGETPMVLALLARGADPAVRLLPAPPALIHACQTDDRPLWQALLGRGGDPHARDEAGQTLLSIASANGNLALAQELIGRGADPSARDRDGSFPLIKAAQSGNRDLAALLLDNGAEVDMADANQATAAFGATLRDDADMLRLLLARNADLAIASRWGAPPEYAIKENKERVMAMLAAEATSRITPRKVLWIGNSYSGHGRVWELVQSLVNAACPDFPLDIEPCLKGGANLKDHFGKTPEADNPLHRLRTRPYDIVLIQGGASLHREDRKAIFREYLPIFIAAARERGAAVVLAGTWSTARSIPATQIQIDHYREARQRFGTAYAPVGEAWKTVLAEKPDWAMHVDPTGHPSSLGVYLNACVYFAVFTGRSPEGLAFEVEEIPVKPEHQQEFATGRHGALDAETRAYLARVAWQAAAPYADDNRRILRGPWPLEIH